MKPDESATLERPEFALRPRAVECLAFRVPLRIPVATSFGIMRDRPAVFVRLEDADGAFGWGEIFANWPAAGAEHRARLVVEDIAEIFLGQDLPSPAALFAMLSKATHRRALQSGEWGPFRQAVAGLDTAAWDLVARRLGQPLRSVLNGSARLKIPVYASGIDSRRAQEAIVQARASGHCAFKIKVGFGTADDADATHAAANSLQPGEILLADANQAWDVESALAYLNALRDAALGWLEEPLPADAPEDDWARLAAQSPVPLAAGENVAGEEAFRSLIGAGTVNFVQPDVTKWGGVTGCMMVARAVVAAGLVYCPHFLGGGIGLAASAHLLAAVGGSGMLEMDVNPNPLREALFPGEVRGGFLTLSSAPGLGIGAIPGELKRYCTLRTSRQA